MMMEQQTTLKIDYLQQRWKDCIRFTCYVYRETEWMRDLLDRWTSIIEEYVERLKIACRWTVESFSRAFKELELILNRIMEDNSIEYKKGYPHTYPRNVNNFRVNTKGFPRLLLRCARSRC